MTRRFVVAFSLSALVVAACPIMARAAELQEVRGRVLETGTDAPIPFVTVQAEGTSRATLSNEQGEYRILVGAHSRALQPAGTVTRI